MTPRETIWRVTFGAIGLFLMVYAALHVFDPKTALTAAVISAGAFVLALDDSVEEL